VSLINRMLQDLDQRQAGASNAAALPAGVQVAGSGAAAGPRLRPQVAALGLLGLGLAAVFHFWEGPLPFLPKPEVAVAVPLAMDAPAAPAAVPVAAVPPVANAEVAPEPAPESMVAPAVVAGAAEPSAPRPRKPAGDAAAQPRQAREVASKTAAAPVEKSVARSDRQHVADFHYRQSLDAYALGRTTESLAQAREALRLDPDHLDARQLLLRQLVEQRDMDAARSVLREGLQRHPEQAAWVKLALRLELEKGDLSAARALVEQAPPAAVAQADFQALAGMLAQRQGRQGEAAEHFRNALGRNPADGRSWIGLGLALEAQGHEPEARESFRRALATEGLPAELQTLAQKKTR